MAKLFDQINANIKEAMRAKDTTKLESLRMLKTAIMNAQIQKKADLSEDDVLGIISKQIKQRKDSAESFRKGNREELAAKEEAEIAVLEKYLPAQMSDTELEAALKALVSENNLSSKKDFGKAMGLARKKLAGQAANQRISAGLGKLLS